MFRDMFSLKIRLTMSAFFYKFYLKIEYSVSHNRVDDSGVLILYYSTGMCPEITLIDSELDTSMRIVGTQVTVTCHTGFRLPTGLTSQVFTCLESEVWDAPLSEFSCSGGI